MNSTMQLVDTLKQNGQDFEWYPTTDEMINVVKRWIPEDTNSIMDIGAGDGRVLKKLAEKCKHAKLYSIEKSTILMQKQPKEIIPVGTDLHEQNLAALKVDYIFSNPSYKDFKEWVLKIIEQGYAKKAFVIIPERWSKDEDIDRVLKQRGATAKVIGHSDFFDGERKSRAVVDIVEITYPLIGKWNGARVRDPFEIWFDNNIDTFDKVKEIEEPEDSKALARRYAHSSIDEIVAAYLEESTRLQENYRAIFKLDLAILQELGVNKEAICGGLKAKIAGLKVKYWQVLFDRLDAITSRLTTKSKEKLLEQLTHNTGVEFTASNAYSVVLWAIKNANQYFDDQLIDVFNKLSQFENVRNYKSNERTWIKDGWRYGNSEWLNTHYTLDYRIVVSQFHAIVRSEDWYKYDYPGNLHKDGHNLIADVIAVLSNLGFSTDDRSLDRIWRSGQWQDFYDDDGNVLFQAKAYMNGNMHFRFMSEAIKALNIEAGRLLKWVRTREEVVTEMGYTMEDAKKYFNHSLQISPSNVPLLGAPAEEPKEEPHQFEQLPEFSSATQGVLL